MNPELIFQERQTRFQAAIQSIQQQLDQIAWLRLLVFVVAAGVEAASWSWGGAWWLLCLFLGMLGFGVVVKWNIAVQLRLRYQQLLLQFNVEEVQRLHGKLGGFDEGADFIDPSHPFTSDLDIFGKHSLFQLMSRAATGFGRRTLAGWLKLPAAATQAGKEVALQRQVAARELAQEIDWRQELQAIGRMQDTEGEPLDSLRAWMQEPGFVGKRPWLGFMPWVAMGLTAVLYLLGALGIVPWGSFFIVLGFNFIVQRLLARQVGKVMETSGKRGKILFAWSEILAKIESLEANAPVYKALKARLATDGRPASAEIARLGRMVQNMEFRDSGLPHFVINTLFYWDVFCLKALEKWKARLGDRILDWFEVIGEVEALNSLAAMRFAFPSWTDAEILDGGFSLEGEDVGHPLIPPQQRVSNPISLAGNGSIWLVTGSNMSGKSTYLRTIGLNTVLALAGAPVCAQRFRLSTMAVVTSMRTTDSLEENTSSFYAELKRLNAVIQVVQAHPNVLFLLDEILKGTNSRDRQAGARALVQQLHDQGGSGLVSTHDIELVDLAGQVPGIHNYSFNCVVSADGQLHFDYLLTPGQCLSMNATALMRAMGIEV
jgi:hypothetical protein